MTYFIVRRLIFAVITLFILSILLFVMSRIQGDPRLLYLNEYATQEQWDQWGREMGLDRPLVVQYAVWVGNILQGDMGRSLRQHAPVTEAILARMPVTLQLAGLGWLFTLAAGVPLGVFAAVKRRSPIDYAARTFTTMGSAVPSFWLAIMLILLFSVELGWLPSARRGGLSHYVMPILVLGPITAAGTVRLTRAAMLEVLDSEFVKLARAKGVSDRTIIWKHAFRNAMIPVITFSGLTLASLLTGTVIVETVFAWPGIGRLAIESVQQNDFPLVMGIVLFFALMYMVVNLIVDLSYALLDPRIRLT